MFAKLTASSSSFKVKHERLFVVSVLGLIVNLVGIYAFQHGHSHGSHGHSHGGTSNHGRFYLFYINVNDLHYSKLIILSGHSHNHSHNNHSHNSIHHDDEKENLLFTHHGHSHTLDMANSQIMRGVFLHILADTLGSVGVIISSVLMYFFGWMIADPICSMFIAILIALSVLSLIRESIAVLMQRSPVALDRALPSCYQKVTGLAGVYSVQEPHFWTLCSDFYVGAIKLEVSRNVDPKYVISHTRMIFEAVGVKQITIQLDYQSM